MNGYFNIWTHNECVMSRLWEIGHECLWINIHIKSHRLQIGVIICGGYINSNTIRSKIKSPIIGIYIY